MSLDEEMSVGWDDQSRQRITQFWEAALDRLKRFAEEKALSHSPPVVVSMQPIRIVLNSNEDTDT
jgi:hypothetical protein